MSADIVIKCDILEMMVAEFEARTSALPTFGYEAPEEALNLMKLAIRHVIGVVTLARADFNLLPSAEVAARAAYEASVRAAWMLAPPTHFEQEARWATHLRGEIDYLEKEIREGKEVMGIDMTGTEQRRDAIADFLGERVKAHRRTRSPASSTPASYARDAAGYWRTEDLPDLFLAVSDRARWSLQHLDIQRQRCWSIEDPG